MSAKKSSIPQPEFKISKWYKLSKGSANYLLGQSEKHLSEHLETAKLLTVRAQTIIGICSPLLVALLIYVLNLKETGKDVGLLFWLPVLIMGAFTVIVILTFNVYWIYKVRPLGNEPANMINDEKISLPDTHQEIAFIVTRLESLQRIIVDTKRLNRSRTNKLFIIDWVIIVTAILGTTLCLFL